MWHYKNKFFREPLCSGNYSLKRAISLGSFLKTNNPDIRFNFFSSCLPRAMETAKAISFGMETDSTERIKILEHISESLNIIDMLAMVKNTGTQNVTTRDKMGKYASFLNKNLKGLHIESRFQSETSICSSSGDLQDDYRDFLVKYILGQTSLLVQGKQIVNVIVSHGGYIRQNVIEPFKIMEDSKKISHPDNSQPFLVKYTYDSGSKDIEISRGIMDTNSESGNNISRKVDDFYKNIASEVLKKNPCSITYTQDIEARH